MNPLRLVAVSFVLFGFFWGGWAVAAADVERDLGLSHGALGLLLSASLAAAAAANAVAGVLAERHGTTRTLAVAFALWSVCLAAGAGVRSTPAFAVSLIAVVAFGGAIDVVMNIAATSALASRPGSLVRFHAFFNVGAALGAAIVGLAAGAVHHLAVGMARHRFVRRAAGAGPQGPDAAGGRARPATPAP